VVPGRVDHLDARFGQNRELPQQEALAAERQTRPVEQVAGDENRVDLFGHRGVDTPRERFASGFAQPASHFFRPAREGGVEVNIGDVNETQCAA